MANNTNNNPDGIFAQQIDAALVKPTLRFEGNNNNSNGGVLLRSTNAPIDQLVASLNRPISNNSAIARSQLRSRVASSRFRSPINGGQQSASLLQLARVNPSGSESATVVSGTQTSGVSGSSLVAPSASLRPQRPVKSRIVRPPSSKSAQIQELSLASVVNSSQVAQQLTTSQQALQASTPVRTTKPRFVVVTRTGQFGIRASAMSSMASSLASQSLASAAASESTNVASLIEPTATVATNAQPSVRVSSRFSKPNRFRGASQTIQPGAIRTLDSPTITTLATLAPESADLATTLSSATTPATMLNAGTTEQDLLRSSQLSSTTTSNAPFGGDGNDNRQKVAAEDTAAGQLNNLDGSASVVVTYFTTTTHTIPFVMNSETIFTTIEETHSRIATEYMKNLNSHFIEPTPMATTPSMQSTATAVSQSDLVNKQAEATTGSQLLATQPTTTQATPENADASLAKLTTQKAAETSENLQVDSNKRQQLATTSIEPSFVVSLNTRTYFTTFTYFTTYSAGSATPTIKSSESTTTNVITETITSTLFEPTKTLQDGQSDTALQGGSTAGNTDIASIEPTLTTKTLLSTMTYYGTLYNGTQTSLTPIVDVSTQILTLSLSPSATFNQENTDSSGSRSIESTSILPSASNVDLSSTAVEPSSTNLVFSSQSAEPGGDKITRTRSLYTTLTHYITFYSGTKTQLSTIQEISPTVVTEYVDRTTFEQQQQQEANKDSSSMLVVPVQSVDAFGMVQPTLTLTPSPVLPPMLATSADTSSTSSNSSPEVTTGDSRESTISATSSMSTTSEAPQQPPLQPATTTSNPTSETLDSVQVINKTASNGGPAENQQFAQEDRAEGKVSASTSTSTEGKSSSTNIIELSDLIAANSSQSGRVAIAGNLGAAIKDIVQLLAGNRTNTLSPLTNSQQQQQPTSEVPNTEQPTTTSVTTQQPATSSSSVVPPPKRAPSRLYGQKAKEHLLNLQGSITSPSVSPTSVDTLTAPSSSSSRQATPELSGRASDIVLNQQQPAATIFFGDDGGDERKKQIKTVWPNSQSTVFLTSIEPSTRSLTLTTTKVYYTRDAPLTITSSFTTLIAPRTFVSTIMGTRTLVNQLNTQTIQQQSPSNGAGQQTSGGNSPSDKQLPRQSASSANQASRQDSQAANHRLSVQQKQQKQQLQLEQQQKKQQQQQLAAASAAAAAAAAATTTVNKQKQAQAKQTGGQHSDVISNANINQCQPMCKMSNNEYCKFHPASETSGAQGTFSCACRPGYHMAINGVGQRQCIEVQSYVVLLRLLQIGDQQVSFKRELQDKSSSEYKQYSKVIKDHVKRAYMTSDLTRDRFVSADILNYARSLSVQQPAMTSTSTSAQPTNGRYPIAVNSSQLDPLNAGIIVNITVQLQPPAPNVNEVLDENTLKEELTKKLNLRQAAAMAAAAAAAANSPSQQQQQQQPKQQPADQQQSGNNNTTSSSDQASSTSNSVTNQDEVLPNPNALFLADVEQVMDLDECANPALNDCHEGAVCINEIGSYKCDCREYPDLNPLHPGRQCGSELKSCDYCNNRGDCIRVPSLLPSPIMTSATNSSSSSSSSSAALGNGKGQSFSTVCQCHRIYLGRRCEINGLCKYLFTNLTQIAINFIRFNSTNKLVLISYHIVLATLLPIVAILLIISVCLVIYCCRRWRKRSALSKGFRNIGTFGPNIIGGTLDRKAMLESSSESSDTHQRSHHLRNANNGIYDTHGGLPVSVYVEVYKYAETSQDHQE